MTHDRHRTVEQSGRAGAALHTAIKLAGATLFGQDRDLKYTWIENPMPHFGSADVIGRSDEEVLAPATAAVVVPVKQAVLESGEAKRVEYRETIGGEVLWFDLRIEPEFGPDGTVIALLLRESIGPTGLAWRVQTDVEIPSTIAAGVGPHRPRS